MTPPAGPSAGLPATGSRERILARIRAAVAAAPEPPVRRAYRTGARMPRETLIELFAERVRDYRAIVHTVPGAEVPGTVAAALARRGVRRLVVPAHLPEAWLERTGGSVERLADDPPLPAAELDRADGVISGCAVAIAETGTIVLDAGPGQGRRALTLVPDYHLCLVRAEQIVPRVPEAIARLDPRRPLTWISGPSATSDIELNRIEGVHGPRTLEVVIITD
ncbi:MAG: lactate utilization protein C [Actinomycetes bacterium]|nr:MAG: lactate utilization protein C [Actinomycetota bacterium]